MILKIKNMSGITQDIHYVNETIKIDKNEEHTIDLSRIQRPELQRIKRIFHHYEVKEDPKDAAVKPQVAATSAIEKEGK